MRRCVPIDTEPVLIDEHQLFVDAPTAIVWESLTTWLARTHLGVGPRFASLVGTRPRHVSGTVPECGATLPGFAVTESVPEDHITLAGRHRFSRYALRFALVSRPDGTVLSARSHGTFPGLAGSIYRLCVIGSGAHRILVRRMLRQVAHRAERPRAS